MILNFELAQQLFDLGSESKAKFEIWIPIAIARCEHFCNLNLSKKSEIEILEHATQAGETILLPKYPIQDLVIAKTKIEEGEVVDDNDNGEKSVPCSIIDARAGKIYLEEDITALTKVEYIGGYDAVTIPNDLGYHVLQYALWLNDNARNAGITNSDIDGVASYAVEQGLPKVIRQVFSAYQRSA